MTTLLIFTAILFAYDYHPLSQTLYDEHISSKKSGTRSFAADEVDHRSSLSNTTHTGSRYNRHRPTNGNQSRIGLVEERIIWSYVLQVDSIFDFIVNYLAIEAFMSCFSIFLDRECNQNSPFS